MTEPTNNCGFIVALTFFSSSNNHQHLGLSNFSVGFEIRPIAAFLFLHRFLRCCRYLSHKACNSRGRAHTIRFVSRALSRPDQNSNNRFSVQCDVDLDWKSPLLACCQFDRLVTGVHRIVMRRRIGFRVNIQRFRVYQLPAQSTRMVPLQPMNSA